MLQIWSGSRLRYGSPLCGLRCSQSLIEKPINWWVRVHSVIAQIRSSWAIRRYHWSETKKSWISPLTMTQLVVAECGIINPCSQRVNTPESQQTAGAFFSNALLTLRLPFRFSSLAFRNCAAAETVYAVFWNNYCVT